MISIQQYPLTQVGIEIIDLFETKEDNEFFIQFARQLKNLVKNVNVSVYKILEENDKYVKHDDNDLIA